MILEYIQINTSMKLVDKQKRSVLSEGRSRGMGFAFLKKTGTTYETVMPISPCKDYLNDVVYSEITGKPYHAHGLSTKKNDIFDDKAYMVAAICKEGARSESEYGDWKEEVKLLETNLVNIQGFINQIEALIGISTQTSMEMMEPNRVLVTMPKFWVLGTYRISLFTLLMRSALKYTDGDPLVFLKNLNNEDCYNWKAALPKLKEMIKGKVPVQDFSKHFSVHNEGIVTYKFPNVSNE